MPAGRNVYIVLYVLDGVGRRNGRQQIGRSINSMMADSSDIYEESIEAPNDDCIGGVGESEVEAFSSDDLIELVRAIKFAHTDMSIRKVHNEICVTMANSDLSYAFLKDVKLNDVKKVWKKALKGTKGRTHENETELPLKKSSATQTARTETINVPPDGVLKFYTVGDGSVKFLVEKYSKHYAEAAVAAVNQEKDESGDDKGSRRYTHFFLDVPADLSGSRPHQALINYQDMQKSCNGKRNHSNTKKQTTGDDGGEIFKIQLAALPHGKDELTPMLLYNADRSAKTFLHPPSSLDHADDDGGYLRIRRLISESGTSGVLGATGGQKVMTCLIRFFFSTLRLYSISNEIITTLMIGLLSWFYHKD